MALNTYTKERLYLFANENKITLYDSNRNIVENTSTFYDDIKREKYIYYSCITCNEFSCKTYRRFLETGAFCKQHIQKNRMEKIEQNYFNKTGYKNPLSNPEVREKIENTCELIYGVKYPMQNTSISTKMSETISNSNYINPMRQTLINDKKKKTYIETLGVEHPSQSEIIKQKKENTTIQNYGVTHPAKSKDVLNKMKKTYKEKTGYDSVSSNPEVRKRAQDTLEKKFGVRYPTQNPELLHKAFTNSFKLKTFTFPSGRNTTYMGYENFAIIHLLNKENIDENDIHTENLQRFVYRKPDENFDRIYTPDIYIKSQNRYIEVKSTYTITLDVDNIFRKQTSIKNKDIRCEIWVIDKCGNIVEKYI